MTPHATAPAASVDGGNATGVPDASRAAEKHKKQRDEARIQLSLSSVQSNHKLMQCSHCLVACSGRGAI